ncbi:MAG: hypothetical protein ACI828_002841 [Flavobacteriales bacterium]|jgi:hypothetical protein
MKAILKITFVFLLISLNSCEDVVDVDLPENEPRIILDAIIRIDPTESFSFLRLKASITSSFFESNETAELSSLQIRNDDTGEFVLFGPEPGIPGSYQPVPAVGSPVTDDNLVGTSFFSGGGVLVLSFNYEGQLYLATTEYVPTVPIQNVVQGGGGLFDPDDTEIIVTFTDTADREDFYIFDFDFGEFLGTEDTFYPGQMFEFSYFYDRDLEVGDTLNISILGADEEFYNYMNLLIDQSEAGDNGPFQVPVTTVRGNFINVTDIDNIDVFDNVSNSNNFALGYFAVVQEYKESIIIE